MLEEVRRELALVLDCAFNHREVQHGIQISLGVQDQEKPKPMTRYWRWGGFN